MNKRSHPLTRVPLKISLVIPVFNNAITLKSQLEACRTVMETICPTYEIIVSNDASSDKSAAILKKYFENEKNFIVINHKKSLGLSKNINLLYSTAQYNYVLLFYIDGAWDTGDIARLAYTAYEKKADIVIGKRKKKAYSFGRKMASAMYNGLILLLFQIKSYDAGSIKIIKKELFEKIKLISSSIFFEGELIIKAKTKGYTIKALSINHYPTNKNVTSRVTLKLLITSFRDILVLRLKKV